MKFAPSTLFVVFLLLGCAVFGQDASIPVTELLTNHQDAITPEQLIDMDGDGYEDIVGRNNYVGIQYGTETDTEFSLPAYPVNRQIQFYYIKDVNDDGLMDFITISEGNNGGSLEIHAYRNNGSTKDWPATLLHSFSGVSSFNYILRSTTPITGNDNYDFCFNYYTTDNNIMACYHVENNELTEVISSSATAISDIHYLESSALGQGMVFMETTRDPLTNVRSYALYWMGTLPNGGFQQPFLLAENISGAFYLRDANDNGEIDLVLQDNSTVIYWQPLAPASSNPLRTILSRGGVLFPYLILDANGDGLIDLVYDNSTDTSIYVTEPFSLFLNGGYEADTMITDTIINFGISNLPLGPRWHGNQVRDIDGNGREEIPSLYFLLFPNDYNEYGSYRLELNGDELTPITTQPNIFTKTLQPVFRPESGNRQAFYAQGIYNEQPSILRLDIEEETAKVFYRPVFELSTTRHAFLNRLNTIYDMASILPLDGGSNFDLAFNYFIWPNEPEPFTFSGKPRFQFNQDATEVIDTSVLPIVGNNFEFVNLNGDGRNYLVEKNSFSIYLDDNMDYIPDSTILEGPYSSNDGILYITDLNNDGLLDFITSSIIMYQQPGFTFQVEELIDSEQYPNDPYLPYFPALSVLIDANEDGLTDVLIPGALDILLLNNGDQSFLYGSANTRIGFLKIIDVESADQDSDGDSDQLFYLEEKLVFYDTIMHGPRAMHQDIGIIPYDINLLYRLPVNLFEQPFQLRDIDISGNGDLVNLFIRDPVITFLGEYPTPPPTPPNDLPSIPPSPDWERPLQATIYPNPTDDMLKISCSNCSSETPAILSIYDSSGRLQIAYPPQQFQTGWKVQQLSSGQYFYRIMQGAEIVSSGLFLKQ